jgi:hypothetical protein
MSKEIIDLYFHFNQTSFFQHEKAQPVLELIQYTLSKHPYKYSHLIPLTDCLLKLLHYLPPQKIQHLLERVETLEVLTDYLKIVEYRVNQQGLPSEWEDQECIRLISQPTYGKVNPLPFPDLYLAFVKTGLSDAIINKKLSTLMDMQNYFYKQVWHYRNEISYFDYNWDNSTFLDLLIRHCSTNEDIDKLVEFYQKSSMTILKSRGWIEQSLHGQWREQQQQQISPVSHQRRFSIFHSDSNSKDDGDERNSQQKKPAAVCKGAF